MCISKAPVPQTDTEMCIRDRPYKYAYYVHCANAYFGEEKAPLQEGEARYVLDKNQRAVTIELLYR